MVELTLTVPDEKLEEFKAGFLKIYPIPDDWEGTDNQWIKDKIVFTIKRIYKSGKIRIAQESLSPEIDEDVIT